VPTPIVEHAHGATASKFFEREDILKKFYRNMRFSFATCFGLRGKIFIVPIFEIGCFLSSLIQLIRGKPMNWRAHAWSKKEIKKLHREIQETRKTVQSTRKLNDSKLFKTIMRNYTLKGFISFIKNYI
jgi:hypothetical protein